MPTKELEERVLLLVKTSRDVAETLSLIHSVGVEGVTCGDLAELCDQIERGRRDYND